MEESTKPAEEKEPIDSEKVEEDKEIKPESDENEAKECDKKDELKETPPEEKVASPKSVEQVETEPAKQKPAETDQLKEEKIEADPVVQSEIKPSQPLTLSYFAGNTVPMIMWPKDRVISNRLENIIQLFESNGEWPQRTLFMYTPAQNMPGTPLGSNPFSISNLVGSSSLNPQALLLAEQRKLMMSPMLADNNSMDGMNETDMYDYDNSNTDMNDDYYKSDSKYQKPKRGRPPKLDLPQMASSLGVSAASATAMAADPANKIRNLLGSSVSSPSNGRESRHRSNMSLAEDQDMGSDYDTPSPTRLKSGKKGGGDENNKSGFLEPGEIFRPKSTRGITKGQPLEDSFDDGSFSKANLNKRGRKSSIKEPIGSSSNQNSMDLEAALSGAANSADASAAAAIQQLAALFMTPGQDPDERIPMINVEDGTRLVGNKAPKRGDLARWLMTHPNYLPDQSELISMTLKNQAALNNPTSSSSSSSNERNMRRMSKSLKQDYMETSSIDEEPLSPPPPPPKSKQDQFGNQKQLNNNNQNKNQQSSKPPQQQAATSSSFDPNAPLVLFNKVTNKRLNSQKVPMWKALPSFLEKNEQVYIDPTCNELVRAKFGRNNLPEIVKSRMINVNKSNPSNKPNNNNNNNQSQQQQTRSNSNSSNISHSPPPQSSKSNNNNNNQSRNKPSKPNNSQQQQQQQQQGLFNPFSPDSAAAAQLQGLTDLLSAAGQVDLNNPLAGFMAAALAGQGGAGGLPFGGLASGAPNPFLMAPFGGMPGMPGANPLANPLLADLFKNMPPGFDMNSFDELTAQLAAAQAQALQQPDSPSAKSINESSSKQSNESKQSSSNNNSNKNKERERERNRDQSEHRENRELRDKRVEADNNKMKKPAPSSNSSSRDKESSESKNSNSNNNNSQKSSSSNKQPSSNSIDSKLNKGQSSSSSSSKKPNESSSSASRNANSSKDNSNKNMDLAAAMQHMDPNAAALAASMMDQEKMLQEMMNLSQFASAFPNNPFYGLSGLPGFPAPSMPSLPSSMLANNSKNNRGRSQSPSQNANGRDRSVSPTSSVASNISQQQAPLDFNMFMNNLMNYQLMGGANGAGSFTAPLPPPPLGLPGLPGDLSKLPVELLTALAQSGGVGGMGGLDPSMFSALAQLNSLSNNVSNEEVASSKESRNQSSKNHQSNKSSSSSNKPSSGSSSHHHNSSSSKSSSSNGSSNMKSSSSSSSSSSKIPPKPSSNNQMKKPSGDQGLDLTMKKPSSFSSSSSSSKPSSKPSSDKLRPPAK